MTKPSNTEGYDRQGNLNLNAGNYCQAIVDFNRSIQRIQPEMAWPKTATTTAKYGIYEVKI